jgi:hypothetical protein
MPFQDCYEAERSFTMIYEEGKICRSNIYIIDLDKLVKYSRGRGGEFSIFFQILTFLYLVVIVDKSIQQAPGHWRK